MCDHDPEVEKELEAIRKFQLGADSAFIESRDAVDDAISYLEIARDDMKELWNMQLNNNYVANELDRTREKAEENLIEAMHRITIALAHTSRYYV